ncbi:GGDEF domain-containing protein [Vibrio sp. PP-XX7]
MKKVQYFVYSLTDISEQYETIQELKEKNEQDPTTTLWNKEKFNQTLIHYARLQERYDDQYTSCLAIIDIDNFKQINDKYGHAVGDEVIKWLANQFINILRDTDFIARIGGDEFAVIMQHAGAKTAQQLMQRFCHTIASHDNYSITISVGIAEITEDHQQTFINADKALYRSKS